MFNSAALNDSNLKPIPFEYFNLKLFNTIIVVQNDSGSGSGLKICSHH